MLADVRRWTARITGLWVALATSVAAAAQTPPAHTPSMPPPALPALALDSFPPEARATISEAHRQAAAHPDDAAAVGQLGMVLHAWEQWQAAEAAYRRAQALAPRATEWPYLAALVALRTGRAADAVTLLDRVSTMTAPAVASSVPASTSPPPSSLALRANLAEALLDAGDLARSGELYRALAKEPAAEPVALYGLGRLASIEKKWDDAIAPLRRACELFPPFGAAHYALALAYRNAGRLDDAQRELALHRQYGPQWPAIDDPVLTKVRALKDDARAHLERGIRLASEDKVAEAIAAHDVALQRDPSNAQAHVNLISLHARLGHWDEVDAHFKAALALKSNLDEAYYNYGVALAVQQRHADAAAALTQAIEVNPAHAAAHNGLGVLLERQNKWDDAAAEYRRAIESQPTFRVARFNLGRALIALKQYDDAIRELERLLTPEDKESPRYVYGLATAYLRAGRREPGVKYAQAARRLALAYDQSALAAAIDKDLAAIGVATGGGPRE